MPVLFSVNVCAGGQVVTVGGSASFTVTVNVQDASGATPLLAVAVTVVVPFGKL